LLHLENPTQLRTFGCFRLIEKISGSYCSFWKIEK